VKRCFCALQLFLVLLLAQLFPVPLLAQLFRSGVEGEKKDLMLLLLLLAMKMKRIPPCRCEDLLLFLSLARGQIRSSREGQKKRTTIPRQRRLRKKRKMKRKRREEEGRRFWGVGSKVWF